MKGNKKNEIYYGLILKIKINKAFIFLNTIKS